MKFKDFEIRPVKLLDVLIDPKQFELVKWYDHEPYIHGESTSTRSCFVVAWLEWNDKDMGFDLESVGLRLVENWVDGLDKFILKWCEMAEVCMEDNE